MLQILTDPRNFQKVTFAPPFKKLLRKLLNLRFRYQKYLKILTVPQMPWSTTSLLIVQKKKKWGNGCDLHWRKGMQRPRQSSALNIHFQKKIFDIVFRRKQ